MRELGWWWLVLVAACGDNEGPWGPPYPVTLVSAEPSSVRVVGGTDVTIAYDGELPADLRVEINGEDVYVWSHTPEDHVFTIAAPALRLDGAALISVGSRTGRKLGESDTILTYYALPASPILEPIGISTLDTPLRPELSGGGCARSARYRLRNEGDLLVTVESMSSTSSAFTFAGAVDDSCAPARELELYEHCAVQVCFDADVTGSYTSTITLHTDGVDPSMLIAASVAASTPNLDPTFHGTGALPLDQFDWYDGRGIARPDGDGIALWSRWQALSIDASAMRTEQTVYTTINGFSVNWLRNMRPGPAGEGIYAVIGDASGGSISAIVHFDDALIRDTVFDEIELPFDFAIGYYRGIELAGSRILAIGSSGVVAIANRQVDTTYGTGGKTTYTSQFRGESVVDSQNRLYLVLDDKVLRLTASGAVDTTFTYNQAARVIAIDSSDRVFVGGTNHAARLSENGSEVVSFPSAAPVDDVAIDATGRVYVVGAGAVQRYASDGTWDRALGFTGTRSIVCPATGACYLLGLEAYPHVATNFVLRLED